MKTNNQDARFDTHQLEMTVLYAMMHDAETCLQASTLLTEDSFQDERNAKLLKYILSQKKRPIDFGLLMTDVSNDGDMSEHVMTVGQSGSGHMTSWAWTSESVDKLLVVQKKKELLNELIRAQNLVVNGNFSNPLDVYSTVGSLLESTKGNTAIGNHIIGPEQLATEFEKRALDAIESTDDGMKTGFSELDECIDGLRPGKLIVVAARPAMGKTALALNIGEHLAFQERKSVVFVSYEMERDDLIDRIACVHLKKHPRFMRDKTSWTQQTTSEIGQVADMIRASFMHIGDLISRDVDKLTSILRLQASTVGVDLVIIDYLQLMTSGSFKTKANRVQEITDITSKLKLLSLELKVPVIVLSQLNRAVESRPGKRPNASDLRDSGSIEQDADVIMFINRNKEGETDKREPDLAINEAKIIVEKVRDGQPRDIVLGFNAEQTRFLNPKKN